MKTGKTIVSVLVMAVVLSCSLFPVFATGTVNKTSSATIDGPNSNCHASVRATQYQGVATAGNGTSTSAYVGQSAIVVTANFYNEGDDPWYLDGVHVQLHDSTTTPHKLTDLDILAGNLTVSQINTPYIFTIGGGENNSYNQGFVVAPHSKLSVAFRVSAFATSDSGNTQFSLDHVSTGAVTNTVGDYPYGLDVDFSPVIDYLESDVIPEMIDQGLSLDEIVDLLTFSNRDITYTYFSNLGAGSTVDTNLFHNPELYVYGSLRGWYPTVLNHQFYNVDSSTAIGSSDTVAAVNYDIYIRLYNFSDTSYLLDKQFINIAWDRPFNAPTGYSLLGYDVDIDDSNGIFVYNQTYTNVAFMTGVNDGGLVIPAHTLYTCKLKYTMYFQRSEYGDSFTNFTMASGNVVPFNFRLGTSITSSVYTTDVQDDLSTIHDQEQQWYQQNEDAIESTGLANYSFTTNQISGIGTISSQFALVWNALGDWTLIYIFVLTLSLATFILRHRPSTKASQRAADSEKMRMINHQTKYASNAHYRYFYDEANK